MIVRAILELWLQFSEEAFALEVKVPQVGGDVVPVLFWSVLGTPVSARDGSPDPGMLSDLLDDGLPVEVDS